MFVCCAQPSLLLAPGAMCEICIIRLENCPFLQYISVMTIEQTIEVPASRRIIFEVPPQIPVGKAKIEFTITPESGPKKETSKSLLSLRGIDKGLDTMDAYFARKRADKAQEDAQFERM